MPFLSCQTFIMKVHYARYLPFAPSVPFSLPFHRALCRRKLNWMNSAADFLALCLPVGFGQWEEQASSSEGERIISADRFPEIPASSVIIIWLHPLPGSYNFS